MGDSDRATRAFRLRFDRSTGRIELDDAWRPAYGPAPGRSYGWDPVIADRYVLWINQGHNRTDRTMFGSGIAAGRARLWWAVASTVKRARPRSAGCPPAGGRFPRHRP